MSRRRKERQAARLRRPLPPAEIVFETTIVDGSVLGLPDPEAGATPLDRLRIETLNEANQTGICPACKAEARVFEKVDDPDVLIVSFAHRAGCLLLEDRPAS